MLSTRTICATQNRNCSSENMLPLPGGGSASSSVSGMIAPSVGRAAEPGAAFWANATPCRSAVTISIVKRAGIEGMRKEMCTDWPARANVEVDDTEYQRNDEKARCDEHGPPCLMSAQNKPESNQRGKRGKIP